MSVDEIESPDNTKDSGILKPPVEKISDEKQVTEDHVGIGVDENGFWHFMIHASKGVHSVIGFLEMGKDAVKAHYIGQMRAEAAEKAKKGLLRPSHIDSIVDKVKGKFRR